MKKYIHYCWFGGKKLPKLAQKCIKSWKKFLPDFEIIRWDESNVDLDDCKFIRDAYDSKKWAFVADYVRTKALCEYGGIYFDTDMEITKNIDFLFENKTFLGVEDSGKIAVGVWYEKNPHSYLPTKLLNYYKQCDGFDSDNAFAFSIPNIMTKLIDDDNFIIGKNEIQKLNNDITIYPREYFYPLSYDRQNNIFTENTCMIHYYDSSWVPKYERRENKIFRLFGLENGKKIINIIRTIKKIIKKFLKLVLFPIVIYKNKKENEIYYNERKQYIDKVIDDLKDTNYVVFYRLDWLGTANATTEIFDNCIGIKDVDSKLANYYAEKLVSKNLDLIIFSAFDISWKDIIKKIKEIKPNQRIKVLWHGSNAMNVEEYDWKVLNTILEYSKYGLIDSIGFVKKSMFEFYKNRGFKCEFVMNTIHLDKEKYTDDIKDDKSNVKIGIYASGDRWVKNFYNQLSAASMIENHIIDCIPRSEKTMQFSNLINAKVIGESKPIPREELLKRVAKNDINIYVTFVDCAPLLPLESLELGVPCITSNNHHYWEGTKLEEYLIVNEPDNIIAIKNKIEYVLANKDKILKYYADWKKDYDIEAKNTVEEFKK